MIKVWLDTETSGLDELRHSVVQVGVVVGDEVFSGYVGESGRSGVRSVGAMMVHADSFSGEMYHDESSLYLGLIKFLKRVGRGERLMACGHNVRFDLGFLSRHGERVGYEGFGSIFSYHVLDTMVVGSVMRDMGLLSSHQSLSLVSLCGVMGVGYAAAHDALSDAIASRDLYGRMLERLRGVRG